MTSNRYTPGMAMGALGLFVVGALVGEIFEAHLASNSGVTAGPVLAITAATVPSPAARIALPTATTQALSPIITTSPGPRVQVARALPTPRPASAPQPRPLPLRAAYVEDLPVVRGAAYDQGLAILNRHRYRYSLWYQFSESCCGGTSVTTSFAVDPRYRHFHAILGMESGGDYNLRFEIWVDRRLLDRWDINPGDPPQVANESIADSHLLTLSVRTVKCVPVECAATTAVWGNAEVTP